MPTLEVDDKANASTTRASHLRYLVHHPQYDNEGDRTLFGDSEALFYSGQ